VSPSSNKPSAFVSFITNMLTYGVGVFIASVLLFWLVAFFWNGVASLRPKPPAATVVTAAPAPAASPSPAPAGGGEDLATAGQRIYSTVCGACHQPTGLGLPNMFPPLASSDWVGAKKPDRLIRMVLHGFTGAFTLNGKPFTSAAPLMPPQGAALSDDQIAGVLTYVRANFGNQAGPVSPAEVKAIREAEKARAAMWTEAELQKIPVE
jgi:mono/diheme cytochrome c family protein